jgi:mRNA interferase RelE/StbE
MHSLKVLPSARRDLDALEPAILKRLKPKILALRASPRPQGASKLTGDEGYRIRVGDYRVLYRIDDKDQVVYLYRIKHRKDVYR